MGGRIVTERIVPVKVWLTPETYRTVDRVAQERRTTIDATIAALVERAASHRPKYTRITAAMIATARRRLSDGETLTAVANDFGCSRLGLRKAITRKETQQ